MINGAMTMMNLVRDFAAIATMSIFLGSLGVFALCL